MFIGSYWRSGNKFIKMQIQGLSSREFNMREIKEIFRIVIKSNFGMVVGSRFYSLQVQIGRLEGFFSDVFKKIKLLKIFNVLRYIEREF